MPPKCLGCRKAWGIFFISDSWGRAHPTVSGAPMDWWSRVLSESRLSNSGSRCPPWPLHQLPPGSCPAELLSGLPLVMSCDVEHTLKKPSSPHPALVLMMVPHSTSNPSQVNTGTRKTQLQCQSGGSGIEAAEGLSRRQALNQCPIKRQFLWHQDPQVKESRGRKENNSTHYHPEVSQGKFWFLFLRP